MNLVALDQLETESEQGLVALNKIEGGRPGLLDVDAVTGGFDPVEAVMTGRMEFSEILPQHLRDGYEKIVNSTNNPQQFRDKAKLAFHYSQLYDMDPQRAYSLVDSFNSGIFGKKTNPAEAVRKYTEQYQKMAENRQIEQENNRRIRTETLEDWPGDYGDVFARPEASVSVVKPWKQVLKDAYSQVQLRSAKSFLGWAQAAAEQMQETPVFSRNYLPAVNEWTQAKGEELFEWTEIMADSIGKYYQENPQEFIQLKDGGYLNTLMQYVLYPQNLVQGLIESAPMMLEGIAGTMIAGPSGGMAAMAPPIVGETYLDARADGTDHTEAFGRALLTGIGEAAIEEWTLGKKLGLAKNFSKIVSSGLPAVLWEGTKAFFRGTAEEGTQEFNRNFWRWVFTDRSQAWTENVAQSAAAGGPMEAIMAGGFAAAGLAADMIFPDKQKARLAQLQRFVDQLPDEAAKGAMTAILDQVSVDVDAGVYEPAAQQQERITAEQAAKQAGEIRKKLAPIRKILQNPTTEQTERQEAVSAFDEAIKDLDEQAARHMAAIGAEAAPEADQGKTIAPREPGEQETIPQEQVQGGEVAAEMNEIIAEAKAAEEKALEKTDEQLSGISKSRRRKLIKQTQTAIQQSSLYQDAVAEGQRRVRDIPARKYYVQPELAADVDDAVENAAGDLPKSTQKKIRALFVHESSDEALAWDSKVTEANLKTTGEAGYMDISEFVARVVEAYTAEKGNRRIDVTALQAAIETGDPYLQLQAEKLDMLRRGFSDIEINEFVADFAARNDIPLKALEDEFIGGDALAAIAAMPEGPAKDAAFTRLAAEQVAAEEQIAAQRSAREILDKNGLTDVPVELVEEIPLPQRPDDDIPFARRGERATGAAVTGATLVSRGQQQVIYLAMGADIETGYHEGYHILRTRLTDDDLATLISHFGADEEAEARAFAEYAANKKAPNSRIAAVFEKLMAILRRIKSALAGKGFRTVEDIFGEIRAGTIAKRGTIGAGKGTRFENREPPKTVKTGYPEKEFTFTGEWQRISQGGHRAAARNRRQLDVPVYKAADGETILWMPESRKASKEGPAPSERDVKYETSAERLRREAEQRAQVKARAARLKAQASNIPVKRKVPKVRRGRLNIKLRDHTPPLREDLQDKPKGFLTPEPPPGKGRTPVSTVVTDEFFEANRKVHRRTVSEVAGKEASKLILGVDRAVEAMSSRLEKIDPSLKHAVRRYVYDVNTRAAEMHKACEPMIRAIRTMSREDRRDFKFAALNGTGWKIEEIVDKYGLQSQYEALRQVLDDIYEAGNEVGIDIMYRGYYWPRIVKDQKGLIEFFERSEHWSVIRQALLKRQEQAGGRQLTDEEIVQVINTLLRGYRVGGVSLARPGAAKERTIELINNDIEQYYYDIDDSIVTYIQRMSEAITAREFFGKTTQQIRDLRAQRARLATRLYKASKRIGYKTPVTIEANETHISQAAKKLRQVTEQLEKVKGQSLEDSVGWLVKDLYLAGKIDYTQQAELGRMLNAIFEPEGMKGIWRGVTKLAYVDVLTSPTVAMTQLEEMGLSVYRSKVHSLPAIFRAATGSSELKLADIGVEDINQYMMDLGFGKVADSLMFMMRRTDLAGKEAFINTSLNDWRAKVKAGDEKALSKLIEIFGDEAGQVASDLKAGTVSENVKYLAFSELADVQPIAITEMPYYYAVGGNMRILYMLKNFMIRRFDILRKRALSRMKNPLSKPGEFVKGLASAVHLVGILTIFGVGKDALKAWFLGRDFDLSDSVIENLLQWVLLSRYAARRIGEGLGYSIVEQLAPPTKTVDAIIRDVKSGELRETPRSIPIIGENYYWWFGYGAEKQAKKNRVNIQP